MKIVEKEGKNNHILIICCLVWLIVIGIIVILFPKGDTHLYINQFHHPLADVFFRYLTHLGDGLVPAMLFVFLLFFSFRNAFLIGVSASLASLIVQLLKRQFFPELLRPTKYLENYPLHFVDGVDNLLKFTFPSGHSASAFVIFFSLAIMANSRWLKFFLFIMAIMVGFSRVYLSQHFLTDVYAGSIIGLLSVLLVLGILKKMKAPWLDKSLSDYFHNQKII
jgi:membrane-associated phospholipid phosphatase